MLIKVEDDRYINLDQIKSFRIDRSDYTGGVSLFADGIEICGGESVDCNEAWAAVIRRKFEEALYRKDWLFDLSAYLEDSEDPFVAKILEEEKEFMEKFQKRSSFDLADFE